MMRLASTLLVVGAVGIATATGVAVSAQPSGNDSQYPGVGDLMNALVQPRHAKLGFAGEEQNWPLADYAAFELQQSFQNIGKLRPTFHGLSLPDMFKEMVGGPLKAVNAAIRAKDALQFAKAYASLTAGCNTCHEALNHPFVVIKAPDHSEFSNQDFRPRRR